MGIPSMDCLSENDFLDDLDAVDLPLCPKLNCLSLYLMLKAFEPIVEKLLTKLLLAACMAVMIRINAKMPSAMITTVIAVRSLLPLMFFQDKLSKSIAVMLLD
jgi:hypothetical protein